LKYTNHTDSNIVTSSGNTLDFDLPLGFPGTKSIDLPLKVSKRSSDINSSHSVISKDTLAWKSGIFNSSYKVLQKTSVNLEVNGIHVTANNTISYWFGPGVGIVRIHQYGHRGDVTSAADYLSNTNWLLLSYKTNN